MWRYSLLLNTALIVSFPSQAWAASGSVQLDDFNFDKVKNKFQASLVKFDKLFPVGDRQNAFMAFAEEMIKNDDVLVAELPVKDYADKTNEALAVRYGVDKRDFPVVKLFVKGKANPITFDEKKGFNTDELRRFVREGSGMYLSAPGCVKEFDKLAIQFMKSKTDERKSTLEKTKELLHNTKKSSSGPIYKTIMEKVLEKGDIFIQTELIRVKNLLNGKVSDEKKKQLKTRVNILKTFQLDQ